MATSQSTVNPLWGGISRYGLRWHHSLLCHTSQRKRQKYGKAYHRFCTHEHMHVPSLIIQLPLKSQLVFQIAYCDYYKPDKREECKGICRNFVNTVYRVLPRFKKKPKILMLLHLPWCMNSLVRRPYLIHQKGRRWKLLQSYEVFIVIIYYTVVSHSIH